MQRQFTATVYIIKNKRTLLIYHKKLKKWLPPGGHLHPNELPSECALREAYEETGLEIALLSQENIWVEPQENSRSFERPYLCLLENIPEHGNEPSHQHMDFVYVGNPIGGVEKRNSEETEDLKWFSWEEIEKMTIGVDLFYDTREAIKKIFVDFN